MIQQIPLSLCPSGKLYCQMMCNILYYRGKGTVQPAFLCLDCKRRGFSLYDALHSMRLVEGLGVPDGKNSYS